ncbi:unnamed protein product [Protopolystoma xenopodis]|uniref:alkaline phosphatase n=1 Tax=Protopolystoma xenopodis TaxID=117903 RepID=A0A3S4ZGK8_9PLAT|nr:unnamed protein product [Protopolystoma xenopodis]
MRSVNGFLFFTGSVASFSVGVLDVCLSIALLGVKTRHGSIGVTGRVKSGDCSSYKPEYNTKSIAMYALEANLSVGLITTTRITHATPSGLYGHVPHRSWEYDEYATNG